MSWLLDTDVLSESSNPRPSERVLSWLDAHDHDVHLSTISLGEIVKGIELMPSGKRRKEIELWFSRIERWAGARLLAPTESVMREWGPFAPGMSARDAAYPCSIASSPPPRWRTA